MYVCSTHVFYNLVRFGQVDGALHVTVAVLERLPPVAVSWFQVRVEPHERIRARGNRRKGKRNKQGIFFWGEWSTTILIHACVAM